MNSISTGIYKQIKNDMPEIEKCINTNNTSREYWEDLRVKYGVFFIPDIDFHVPRVREGGTYRPWDKVPNYTSELRKLRTYLLATLIKNEYKTDFELSNDFVKNEAKELLKKKLVTEQDVTTSELIILSKIYIDSDNSDHKQFALEKIWDVFERLKTIYGEGNKKKNIEDLIKKISHSTERNKLLFDNEFKELTKIGNEYQIRHFEKDKEPIPSDDFREYLFFRVLSLISYSIIESEK
ncbi:hypothetical protein ERX27_10765 [Macrococcus brunensis]|uniref:Uncharacterized protein n=1 Tax=Macrococcus brunensis TaxID=198483 RepID=A0A4R6BAL8_9STAP|nr:hypothetical protein [Macrococcus brunensis]TDL93342.1 hypothetical protein ERX27_10765 [Macrococcus brunensis]